MKKEVVFQGLKFLGFSLIAGVIQFGSYALLTDVFHLAYSPAYIISVILSVLYNFTFNRKFTFKSHNNIPLAMSLVGCYYAAFIPLSDLWGNALVNAGWNDMLVTAMNMIINFVTEFLYQKFVVFRVKKKEVLIQKSTASNETVESIKE